MSSKMIEYINSQRVIWGDEYVDDLIDGGYLPVLTSAGWRWLLVDADNYATIVEQGYRVHETTNG